MFNVPKKEEQLEIQVKREHLFILCLISSSKFVVSHLCFNLCEISGCWPIGLILHLYLQMFTSLLYMIAPLPLSTNKISSESKFSSFYIMVSSISYVLSSGSFLINWIPVCHPSIESLLFFFLFFSFFFFLGYGWLTYRPLFSSTSELYCTLRYIFAQIISSSHLSSFN